MTWIARENEDRQRMYQLREREDHERKMNDLRLEAKWAKQDAEWHRQSHLSMSRQLQAAYRLVAGLEAQVRSLGGVPLFGVSQVPHAD